MTAPSNKPNFRYERKFLVQGVSREEMELLVKHNPKSFREVFHPRQVNNIYFDTLALTNYFDNVEGERSRVKVRIRWYDRLFGRIEKPVLEYKIKRGFLGTKLYYNPYPFTLDENFSKKTIVEAISKEDIPVKVKDELLGLQPTLLNHYTRKYFLSEDKNYRITIDYGMTYYGISYNNPTFLNKSEDRDTVIIELKYTVENDSFANEISNQLPFRLTKSSKYLQGLERVLL